MACAARTTTAYAITTSGRSVEWPAAHRALQQCDAPPAGLFAPAPHPPAPPRRGPNGPVLSATECTIGREYADMHCPCRCRHQRDGSERRAGLRMRSTQRRASPFRHTPTKDRAILLSVAERWGCRARFRAHKREPCRHPKASQLISTCSCSSSCVLDVRESRVHSILRPNPERHSSCLKFGKPFDGCEMDVTSRCA